MPRNGYDEARWIERLMPTGQNPTEGAVKQGMVQVGEAFRYTTKDGDVGTTRFVHMLNTNTAMLVKDADQIQEMMTRALNTPKEGAGQIALVQITTTQGADSAGVMISRRRDETAEEAVQRELVNQKAFLVDTLTNGVRDTGGILAAQIMTGQSYFIGAMSQQQDAAKGFDPVIRDEQNNPAWAEAVVHLLHHGNNPENPMFAAKVATTVARTRIEPVTTDEITPAKVIVTEKAGATEGAQSVPAAGAHAGTQAGTQQAASTGPASTIGGQRLGDLGGDALTEGLAQVKQMTEPQGGQRHSKGPGM